MEKIIKRGDVFWAILGDNKGSEQSGVRPVVVIQNNLGNKFSPTVIVAAVTSKINKRSLPTHVFIEGGKIFKMDSVILVEQILTIDKIKLGDYIGSLDSEDKTKLNQAIKISTGLNDEDEDIEKEIDNRCKSMAKQIENLDSFIKLWIDRMGNIGKIEDIINQRKLKHNDLIRYCSRMNKCVESYYIDLMGTTKTIKVV